LRRGGTRDVVTVRGGIGSRQRRIPFPTLQRKDRKRSISEPTADRRIGLKRERTYRRKKKTGEKPASRNLKRKIKATAKPPRVQKNNT